MQKLIRHPIKYSQYLTSKHYTPSYPNYTNIDPTIHSAMSRVSERALPVYLQTLKQSENLGEEVLADQQQIVELDNRRQTNRLPKA